jgi:hypothetical protein
MCDKILAIPAIYISLSACAPIIIDPGWDQGDQGGGGGEKERASVFASGSGAALEPAGPMSDCSQPVCGPTSEGTCSCTVGCTDATFKISCGVEASGVPGCVCTFKDLFSGVCFEEDPDNLCDFNEGCCAKYFHGK